MSDNLLVIGSGAREHALCWKLLQSKEVKKIFWAPGNGALLGAENIQPCATDPNNFEELSNFAQKNKIALTVVGPEAPLAAGIVDYFRDKNLAIFGPDKYASKLEASKSFSKKLCEKAGIPSAKYSLASSFSKAEKVVKEFSAPLVIKADGLAAGKGVFICQNKEEALTSAKELLQQKSLGDAGEKIVIEEFLRGTEASFMALVCGEKYCLLPTSRDHKRLLDNDLGPNTGGMGAFSPSDQLTDEIIQKTEETILKPILKEMVNAGHPYQGVIYLGLMIDNNQPQLLEINVRLGDPEAQVLLPRLADDLYPHLCQIANKQWTAEPLMLNAKAALCVVLASEGYPQAPQKGQAITNLGKITKKAREVVFHAGTAVKDNQLVVNGGRVLTVTALADKISEARESAYNLVSKIDFNGKIYRKDIGLGQ